MMKKGIAGVVAAALMVAVVTVAGDRIEFANAGEVQYLTAKQILDRVIGGMVRGPEFDLTYKVGGDIEGENTNSGPFWGKWSVRDDGGKGVIDLDYDYDPADKTRHLTLSEKDGKQYISFYTLKGELKGTFRFVAPKK